MTSNHGFMNEKTHNTHIFITIVIISHIQDKLLAIITHNKSQIFNRLEKAF